MGDTHLSRRITTSSRRPGEVFDRNVRVRLLDLRICEQCGHLAPFTGLHSVRAHRGQLIDCVGRSVEQGPNGWQLVEGKR